RSQLHVHLCSHSGENPHKCDLCESSFQYPSQLRRHRITHTSSIEYRCEQCSSVFDKWSELQAHRQSHGPKMHACEQCGARFKRLHTLGRHLLTHDPERPLYACPHDECSRFYLDDNSLRAHIAAVHRVERSRYLCEHPDCDKSYAYAHTLRRHIAQAHGADSKDSVDSKPEKRTRGPARKQVRQPTFLEIASGMAYQDPSISGRSNACTVDGCSFRFKRAVELDTHMVAVHGKTELLGDM
ncbi:hypothetical protein LPJ75_004544, partial [Coemansia sp. RSA 2598]